MRALLSLFISIVFCSVIRAQDVKTVPVPTGRPLNATVKQAEPSQIVNVTDPAFLKTKDLPCRNASASELVTITDPALVRKTTVKTAIPSQVTEKTDPTFMKEGEKRTKKEK